MVAFNKGTSGKWASREFRLATGVFATFLMGLFVPSPGATQDVIAGWEGTSLAGYGSVSAGFGIPLSTSSSVVVRPTASYLYYDVRFLGAVVNVTAPAVSLGVGYSYSDGRIAFGLGPAIRVLWESRKFIGGFTTERTLVGVGVSGDISFQATPRTNLSLMAGYDNTNEYCLSRAAIKQAVTELSADRPWWLSLGAEAGLQGSDETQVFSAGGLGEIAFDQGRTALQIRGGYSWVTFRGDGSDQRPYFGAGLYHRF